MKIKRLPPVWALLLSIATAVAGGFWLTYEVARFRRLGQTDVFMLTMPSIMILGGIAGMVINAMALVRGDGGRPLL